MASNFIFYICLIVLGAVFLKNILFLLFCPKDFFESFKKRPFLNAFCSLILILFFAALLIPVNLHHTPTQSIRTRVLMINFNNAFKAYANEYGAYPLGENAGIVKVLSDENPKKIKFIEFRKSDLNSKGEVLDGWGTPLRFALSEDKTQMIVSSAGKDKIWDNKDDLKSN